MDTSYKNFAARNTWSARYLSRGNVVYFASDLLPVLDVISMLLVSLLLMRIHGSLGTIALTQGSAMHPTLTSTNDSWHALILASLVAPFILYDRLFGVSLQQGSTRSMWATYAVRYAVLTTAFIALRELSTTLNPLPPRLLGEWLMFGLLWTATTRLMVSRLLKRLQTRGALAENIAIVGSGSLAIEFARAIQSAPAGRVRMLGFFDDAAAAAANSGAAAGTIDQLLELALKQNIDWIVLALPQAQEVLVAPMIERLRGAATRIGLCPKHPDFYRMPRARLRVGESFTLDLLLDQPIVRWNAVFKRAEDLVIGGLLTLLLSPLLAVVAIAVKLDSPGPVIFRQRRHTLSNREFDIYKFRTMHSGPNAVATPLVQTTRNDARITRVGAVLRSFSIDELPQLFNVLQGTMSLVGPRPHATDMRTDERLGVEITEEYLHRHRVKPGITGWAQVNGARGATDTEDQLLRRVELDLYYIDKWSLRLDLQIILRTVSVVISRNNAF